MDITPQVINEVEFHQKMRGYDPDEVDDFLERVAVAVGELHDEVGQARSRLAAAEQRAADAERDARAAVERAAVAPAPAPPTFATDAPEPVHDDDEFARRQAESAAAAEATAAAEAEFETLKRTLVLAQRTADAAIREAEEEAARTTAAAQAKAKGLVAEAGEEAHRVVRAAEQDARKAHEDTRQRLVREVGALETARDALKGDVGAFERHIDEQRTRLRGTVTELQRLLDDPGRLRAATVPTPSEVSLPASVRGDDGGTRPPPPATPAGSAPAGGAPAGGAPGGGAPTGGAPASRPAPARPAPTERPSAPRARPDVQATRAGDRDPGPPRAASQGSSGMGGQVDEGAWSRFASGDGGPPTQPVPRAAPAAGDDDDAYLSELRKAMLDDTSAPDVGPEGVDDNDAGRGRFGRRRS